MYYDIVNSGERIKELRAARRMTRQQLAEQIGLSVDALRKMLCLARKLCLRRSMSEFGAQEVRRANKLSMEYTMMCK